MILFWIIASISVAISIFILVRTLLRKVDTREDDRHQQNIQIAKERLKELEQEYQENTLSKPDYEQLREELESALLSDVTVNQSEPGKHIARTGRAYMVVLLLAIPILSISLYLGLGNPDFLDKQMQSAQSGSTNPHSGTNAQAAGSMEIMIRRLAEKLENDPGNGEGWYLLGRSYLSMGDYSRAANALERAHRILGDDPGLLLKYADAVAMTNQGRISGKPFELVQKALKLSPNEPTGLWLAGMGYEEQGNYRQAAESWKKLLPILRDEQSQQKIRNMIARVNTHLADNPVIINTPAAVAPGKGITVKVDIAENIKNKVAPDASLFVFAQAQGGSRMPLAVVRKQVKDLPLTITLNDSMAMTQSMRISQHSRVNIIARVSLAGTAMPQKGDFQSNTQQASPGQQAVVKLLISSQIP